MKGLSKLVAVCALLVLAGCSAQLGPRTIPASRFDYSEALARSWDEQLLLNLVRLRYRDTPLFLEVGSIVTHYPLGATAGHRSADQRRRGHDPGLQPGVPASPLTEEPTVTYGPLQGADFVARLLTPVAPSNLLLPRSPAGASSGSSSCCVQPVNNCGTPLALRAHPGLRPTYESFQHLPQLLLASS